MSTPTGAGLDPLLDTKEAAAYLRTTENALRQLRYLKRGPRFVKNGARVLYRASDLKDYLDLNTHGWHNEPGYR